jgi:hypothetical protein
MDTLQKYFEPLKASKAERLKALKFVHKNPTSYHELFELAVSKKAKRVHIYASWVWELFILEDITKLDRYWSKLVQKIDGLNHPSMRRVHSKIIWLYLKDKNRYKALSRIETKRLISIFLDWVITENKTAPLSFSIRILALFTDQFPKLKTDLEGILLHSKRTLPKGTYPVIRTVFKD